MRRDSHLLILTGVLLGGIGLLWWAQSGSPDDSAGPRTVSPHTLRPDAAQILAVDDPDALIHPAPDAVRVTLGIGAKPLAICATVAESDGSFSARLDLTRAAAAVQVELVGVEEVGPGQRGCLSVQFAAGAATEVRMHRVLWPHERWVRHATEQEDVVTFATADQAHWCVQARSDGFAALATVDTRGRANVAITMNDWKPTVARTLQFEPSIPTVDGGFILWASDPGGRVWDWTSWNRLSEPALLRVIPGTLQIEALHANGQVATAELMIHASDGETQSFTVPLEFHLP